MCAGFITISKKLLKWEWADDPFAVALWLRLLLKASYEDKQWHGMTIQRGQLVTSSTGLAEESGMTRQQVRTRLVNLQNSGCITIKSTNKYSIITICKYDSYQPNTEGVQPAEQPTNNQQSNQQITTSKEYNKENKYNISPISPLKGESPKKKKSMEERAKEFYQTIIPYVDKYGAQTCREFYDYWTEPYQNKDKMRFEGQKTWSINLRLSTWAKREGRYGTRNTESDRLRPAQAKRHTAEEYEEDF